MELSYDYREFHPFTPSHYTALVVLLAVTCFAIQMHAKKLYTETFRRKFNVTLAVLLLAAVVADPLLVLWRFHDDPETRNAVFWQSSLPFYWCDIVSLILAAALWRNSQRLAEIGYLWGVAGTTQGLITPTLYFDWNSPEYYAFFVQHGGVPLAGLLMVFGMGHWPEKGAFWRSLGWSFVYLLGGFAINAALRMNYGFLNEKPKVPTLMDHMGPWPWYLVVLTGMAAVFYLVLLGIAAFFQRRRAISQEK